MTRIRILKTGVWNTKELNSNKLTNVRDEFLSLHASPIDGCKKSIFIQPTVEELGIYSA
jgi:hypothetical protein